MRLINGLLQRKHEDTREIFNSTYDERRYFMKVS